MRYKRSAFIILFFAVTIYLFTHCLREVKQEDPRGRQYAGSFACQQCHQAVYDSFLQTAHFKASSPPAPGNILGIFDNDSGTFAYDSAVQILLKKRDSGYLQVLTYRGNEMAAYRFDILFGIRHAQTSLYWNGERPFELPVSWYTSANAWATSPGFSAGKPDFERFIGVDCFECHTSNIKKKLHASVDGIQKRSIKKHLSMVLTVSVVMVLQIIMLISI